MKSRFLSFFLPLLFTACSQIIYIKNEKKSCYKICCYKLKQQYPLLLESYRKIVEEEKILNKSLKKELRDVQIILKSIIEEKDFH